MVVDKNSISYTKVISTNSNLNYRTRNLGPILVDGLHELPKIFAISDPQIPQASNRKTTSSDLHMGIGTSIRQIDELLI
jgi:hypothetical protein